MRILTARERRDKLIEEVSTKIVIPKRKLMIVFDYAGLELRQGCNYHMDKTMITLLKDPDKDMHGRTALELSVPRDPVAKETNFLLQYFGTPWTLAEHLTNKGAPTTIEEADAYHKGYHRLYPGVEEDGFRMLAEHKQNGFITFFTGRRRWIDDIDWKAKRSVHKALTTLSNNRVQGAGQDFVKAAIIRCDPKEIDVDYEARQRVQMPRSHDLLLREYSKRVRKARALFVKANLEYVLQVHDEVIFFADEKACTDIAPIIGDMMCWKHPFPRNPRYRYVVPMVAEGGIGENWKQAKGKTPIEHFKIGYDSYELEAAA